MAKQLVSVALMALIAACMAAGQATATPGRLEDLPESHRIVFSKMLDEAVRETNKSPIELITMAVQSDREQKLREASRANKQPVEPLAAPLTPLEAQPSQQLQDQQPPAEPESPATPTIKIQITPSEPNPIAPPVAPEPPRPTASPLSLAPVWEPTKPLEPSKPMEPMEPMEPLVVSKPSHQRAAEGLSELLSASASSPALQQVAQPESMAPQAPTAEKPTVAVETMGLFENPSEQPKQVQAATSQKRSDNGANVVQRKTQKLPRGSSIDETFIDHSDPSDPKRVRVTEKSEAVTSEDGGSRAQSHQSTRVSSSLGDNPNHFSRSSSSSSSFSSSSASINGKPVDPALVGPVRVPHAFPFLGFGPSRVAGFPRIKQQQQLEQTRVGAQDREQDDADDSDVAFGRNWHGSFMDPEAHMAQHSRMAEHFMGQFPSFDSAFARRARPSSGKSDN